MDNVYLIKHTKTDVKNKRFGYDVLINNNISKELWFPWYIVGHTFPYAYPEGSEISVSYFGDKFRDTVDWIGRINR